MFVTFFSHLCSWIYSCLSQKWIVCRAGLYCMDSVAKEKITPWHFYPLCLCRFWRRHLVWFFLMALDLMQILNLLNCINALYRIKWNESHFNTFSRSFLLTSRGIQALSNYFCYLVRFHFLQLWGVLHCEGGSLSVVYKSNILHQSLSKEKSNTACSIVLLEQLHAHAYLKI